MITLFCIALVFGALWIGFKLTGAIIMACLWLFIKVPIALLLSIIGLICCCTIILIPLGLGIMKLGIKMFIPGV